MAPRSLAARRTTWRCGGEPECRHCSTISLDRVWVLSLGISLCLWSDFVCGRSSVKFLYKKLETQISCLQCPWPLRRPRASFKGLRDYVQKNITRQITSSSSRREKGARRRSFLHRGRFHRRREPPPGHRPPPGPAPRGRFASDRPRRGSSAAFGRSCTEGQARYRCAGGRIPGPTR